jgi:hypothetical protein
MSIYVANIRLIFRQSWLFRLFIGKSLKNSVRGERSPFPFPCYNPRMIAAQSSSGTGVSPVIGYRCHLDFISGSVRVPRAAFGVSPNASFPSLNPQLPQLSTGCSLKVIEGNSRLFATPLGDPLACPRHHNAISGTTPCLSALCVISADSSTIQFSPKVPCVSRCPATSLEANKEKSPQKNSDFFSGHFHGNHWETLQKPPKKPCETAPKMRAF